MYRNMVKEIALVFMRSSNEVNKTLDKQQHMTYYIVYIYSNTKLGQNAEAVSEKLNTSLQFPQELRV